ncbi:ADP-ribosylglycohydrolase family protein [Gallibacterium genomosp. 3]|uniref:ADP-ribosylglycohydrolase n=1 Tax=Gallibacterium genomosp. 3 TaxID=505345 RepID=A0A1A7Q9B9_9PAST|nr:ADP-ribosylglycohydrolase family protein [Gallibacterium genomosp. 3]OBX10789.1 ADP-ribosylglycohydrolase [Gallibacterium genomosp. 3]
MNNISLLERAKGCLLGLACGDAVGTTLEFKARKWIKTPLTDMVGGGKFNLERGKWTDDTSMAICLAESLIHCAKFDPIDQLERYYLWASTGYNSSTGNAFGIGKHTVQELINFHRTKRAYSENINPKYSGNGSLMRLAPIALYYFNHPDLGKYAQLSSKTTHASSACLQSCEYFAYLLQNALQGKAKAELFVIDDDLDRFDTLQGVIDLSFQTKSAEDIQGNGYVINSLEAALWAFWHTETFKDAILLAANLGDDADTTSAICGQIAGAFYGINQIPQTWLSWLYRRYDIESLAMNLISRSMDNDTCV